MVTPNVFISNPLALAVRIFLGSYLVIVSVTDPLQDSQGCRFVDLMYPCLFVSWTRFVEPNFPR